jgi:hypothetical protein
MGPEASFVVEVVVEPVALDFFEDPWVAMMIPIPATTTTAATI